MPLWTKILRNYVITIQTQCCNLLTRGELKKSNGWLRKGGKKETKRNELVAQLGDLCIYHWLFVLIISVSYQQRDGYSNVLNELVAQLDDLWTSIFDIWYLVAQLGDLCIDIFIFLYFIFLYFGRPTRWSLYWFLESCDDRLTTQITEAEQCTWLRRISNVLNRGRAAVLNRGRAMYLIERNGQEAKWKNEWAPLASSGESN